MKVSYDGRRRCLSAARLVLCVILVLAASGARPAPARAVGMVSHKHVVDTASSPYYSYRYPKLARLLRDYPGAVASGSMFPDWGYSINVLSSDDEPWTGYSEVAHEHADCVGGTRQNHLSYRDAFANILHSQLSPPYTEDDLKTIAFWFGLVSHVETDETFDRDFMPVAIEEDGGNHMGVDLVVDAQVKKDTGWAEPKWFFPLEAIAAAYQAVGCKEITVDMMERAVHDEFIPKINSIVWGEPALALGYKSNWMRSNYQRASGGMNDLYQATATAWQNQWDTWKPVTTILLSPAAPDGDDGAYHQPVTIQFEATDFLNGQIETWYSLDGGPYQVYTGPFTVSADGTYEVSFYSVNNSLGLSEDPQTVTIVIGPDGPLVCDGPNLLVNGSFEQSDWTHPIWVPGWFGNENQGGGVATADLDGNGQPELIVFHIDNPPGGNAGYYRVGRNLNANGKVTGGWTERIRVDGWFGDENQGGGVATADLDGNGQPELIVFHIDNPAGGNAGYYRVGRNLNANGKVTGGWTGPIRVDGWFGNENQGGGVAIADLDGNGQPELIVFHIDNPAGGNAGYYRVGRNLDANGKVTGGWTGPIRVDGWFGNENQGGGVAIADLDGNGQPELIVFHIDNPGGKNAGYYRVGRNLDANGKVTGGWTDHIAVPGWFGNENQGGGVAIADLDGSGHPGLIVFHIDNPGGKNVGYYCVDRNLDAPGIVAGFWTAFDNGGGAQYGFLVDSWAEAATDGKHSQLIEIRVGLAGIHQKVRLHPGDTYALSFDAMMRAPAEDLGDDPYGRMVGWGYSRNGGTDQAAADHTEWLPLQTIYPMDGPASMWPFQTTFVAPSDDVTVWIYAQEKYPNASAGLFVNLDNAVLHLCRPVTPEPPEPPEPPPVVNWVGSVKQNLGGSTPTLRVESAIAVVVSGKPGLVVDIHSGGWTATCTTGNKAEYGPNACEFGGLRASTYTIAPRGLGASVQVTVDGEGWALVQFDPVK